MKDLKVVFMGTPEFAVPVLKSLINNCNVILVVSQPDREKDRKGNLLFTPTKKVAMEEGIPVLQLENIRKEYDKVLEYNPDIIVTCAYGQIVPTAVLDFSKYGAINVHGSLLPKYRGGAPIHHAIINGDKETGITIMYMDKGMDSGDIISQESLPILDDDNLDSIYNKMSLLGASLLIKTLPSIIDGTNERIKQDETKVTFAYNISKDDEKLNFNMKANDVFNKIRGLSSVPGSYAMLKGLRVKIYSSYVTNIKSNSIPGKIEKIDKNGIYVSTNDYLIALTDIKIEGKKRCFVKDFINGIRKEEYEGEIFYNE